MTMDFWNFWYILSLCLLVILPLMLYLILRGKSEKTIKYTLLIIAFLNFALHFLKILHPDYLKNIEDSLIKISLENICAISTVFLPFAMMCKNKVIKTYLYFISFVGGLMAIIITTDPVGRNIFEFNTIRYYFCHYVLMTVPTVSLLTKEFKPQFKTAIWMPFMFLLGQTIILVNELVLWGTGLIDHNITTFFSPYYHNPSFVFGPNETFKWTVETFGFLVPTVFKTNVFGIEGLTDCYMPVLWTAVPVIVAFPIFYTVLTLPFTYHEVIDFINRRKQK